MPERVFQPSRLVRARKLRGLTQKALSHQINKTPAAVSQYESGTVRPAGDVIERLALKLGCAPEWFFRPIRMEAPDGAFFRSLRVVPARERDKALAYALSLAELIELIETQVSLPEPQFEGGRNVARGTDRSVVEGAALRLRATWGVPPGPVGNVVRVAEAKGASIAAVGVFDSRLDAFSVRPGRRPVIVLCSDSGDAGRRRFDAAHELGHLCLHPSPTNEHWQEAQAHAFAAAFLMPAEEIEPWLPRRSEDFDTLREGSSTWGVSMQALLRRGRDLDTLSESAYHRTMRRIAAAGWRTREPVALGPPEAPVMLTRALAAWEAAGAKVSDLADRFGVAEGRLRRMLAVPEEHAGSSPGEVISLDDSRVA